MDKKSIINIDEICSIFKEYCEKNKTEFSKQRFEEFLKFLEIDFYDWVRQNLRQYHKLRNESGLE